MGNEINAILGVQTILIWTYDYLRIVNMCMLYKNIPNYVQLIRPS